MTDHAAAMLMPPLLRRVRAAATNVKVEVSAWHSHVYEDVTAEDSDTALSAEAAPAVLEPKCSMRKILFVSSGPLSGLAPGASRLSSIWGFRTRSLRPGASTDSVDRPLASSA